MDMISKINRGRDAFVGKTHSTMEINGHPYSAHPDGPSPRPAPAIPAPPILSGVMDVVRKPAKHANSHKPDSSHILMRNGVKKPETPLKRHTHAQGANTKPAAHSLPAKQAKHQLHKPAPGRLHHAQNVPKSPLITHFTADQPSTYSPAPAVPAQAPAEAFPEAPVNNPSAKPRTTAELLEQAVANASSHEEPAAEPAKRKRSKRKVAAGAGLALLAVLIGVGASQTLSNGQLQLASSKAGFHAVLPSYHPSGFSQGALDYSPGIVAAKFNSNGNDDRGYTITQKKTSWTDEQLADNIVLPSDKDYQQVKTTNQNIYIYGNHNATWIKNGIWYQLRSDGSLSDRQLIQLATSL
jgi:hypothetical protein